ncbi:hypothetical protein FW774_15180 [Pedobacter sp. BS3]|uniref:hypothetical protein n=1 Tax=Pedobacter sp. BS3 TaxID=2567937 RepID=UPI0011ED83C7|nr:hypothetical protein [Pedobacter sp. BS3]TZF82037.1 hypothetical protein FW774_15180 [Pedobacter sp. BS3]
MAHTAHYYTKFEEGQYYHVYNRTVNQELLFRTDNNYSFFLKKYDKYLSPVINTYTYCLLNNHFHLLIRVKSDLDLKAFRRSTNPQSTHEIISRQFRKFFQSYAMAFNKQQNRVGTLFQTPFKRALISDEYYFTQLVYYIHANPQKHGLIGNFREWHWSSTVFFIIQLVS